MKNTDEFFKSIQKQINEFMGDQVHSYVFVVHQCGEGECRMDLTTNMDSNGVIATAIEVLEQHADKIDDLLIIDDGKSSSSEKDDKKTIH